MRLEEAKKLYVGEWIAFQEFGEEENPEGQVEAHHKDRDILINLIQSIKRENLYITYANIEKETQHAFML